MPNYTLAQALNAAQINVPPDIVQNIQKLLNVSQMSSAVLSRDFSDIQAKLANMNAAMKALHSERLDQAMWDMAKISPRFTAQISTALSRMRPLLEHPDLLELQKALAKMPSWLDIPEESEPRAPAGQESAPSEILDEEEDKELIHDIDAAVENTLQLIPELKKQCSIDGYAIENVAMMVIVLVFTAVPPDDCAKWLEFLWDAFLMCVKELGTNPTAQGAAIFVTLAPVICRAAQKILKLASREP